MRMRRARSRSLSLVARRSTMRLPQVLPSCTIVAVLIIFSAILVALPAFKRVLPVTTSGPTSNSTGKSTAWALASADSEVGTGASIFWLAGTTVTLRTGRCRSRSRTQVISPVGTPRPRA